MNMSITWAGGTIDLSGYTAREIGVRSNDQTFGRALGVRHGQRNFSPRRISVTQNNIDWQEDGAAFMDFLNDVGRDTAFTFTSDTLGTFTVRLASFQPMSKRAPVLGDYSFVLEEDLA
jgi:hypothetical protein